MFRMSKLSDYATVVLVRLAEAGPDAVQTSPGIAQATGVPEPTVAKVLKAMAAGRLVVSQRGARGGYRLGRALSAISVADVVEVIDGPIALTACVEGGGSCETGCRCPLRGRWEPVNTAIRAALGAITLADMRAAAVPPAFRTQEAAQAGRVQPIA